MFRPIYALAKNNVLQPFNETDFDTLYVPDREETQEDIEDDAKGDAEEIETNSDNKKMDIDVKEDDEILEGKWIGGRQTVREWSTEKAEDIVMASPITTTSKQTCAQLEAAYNEAFTDHRQLFQPRAI